MAKTQSRVSRDPAPPPDDLGNAVRGHFNLTRQFGRRDTDLLQLVGEDFAGVDGWPGHRHSSLLIVHDLDVRRPGVALRPFEANPPLQIDADAELALAVAA